MKFNPSTPIDINTGSTAQNAIPEAADYEPDRLAIYKEGLVKWGVDETFKYACSQQHYLMLDFLLTQHNVSKDCLQECLIDTFTHHRLALYDYFIHTRAFKERFEDFENILAISLVNTALMCDLNGFKTIFEIELAKKNPNIPQLLEHQNYLAVRFAFKSAQQFHSFIESTKILEFLVENDYILGTSPHVEHIKNMYHQPDNDFVVNLFIAQENRRLNEQLPLNNENKLNHLNISNVELENKTTTTFKNKI